MGKIQMSKGNPQSGQLPFLSSCSQSSKVGGGSYCFGMGEVWRSNSNLGSHPFLGKCFLSSWASKGFEIPSQVIIDPCIFLLTQLEIAGAFSLMFLLFSSFFPWLGIRLGNAQWLGSSLGVFVVVFLIARARKSRFCFVEWICSSDSRFGGFKRPFLVFLRKLILLGIFIMISWGFRHWTMPTNSFLCF